MFEPVYPPRDIALSGCNIVIDISSQGCANDYEEEMLRAVGMPEITKEEFQIKMTQLHVPYSKLKELKDALWLYPYEKDSSYHPTGMENYKDQEEQIQEMQAICSDPTHPLYVKENTSKTDRPCRHMGVIEFDIIGDHINISYKDFKMHRVNMTMISLLSERVRFLRVRHWIFSIIGDPLRYEDSKQSPMTMWFNWNCYKNPRRKTLRGSTHAYCQGSFHFEQYIVRDRDIPFMLIKTRDKFLLDPDQLKV